ncbi:MAG: Uma2 family endonuclease [Saprospiraceae bacterium]|nr:Uma2 family endonuclease [Saprospiraceae bacterium]
MNISAAEQLLTAEEYLELEKHSETRHEYYFGKLLPMPGESLNSNEIVQNWIEKLRRVLREKGYRTFAEDIKVMTAPKGVYRYPDFVVAKAKDCNDPYVIDKPVFLVEVASKDSYDRDRFDKFREYTSLPTLQHYLIVHSEKMVVEFFSRRDDASWDIQIFIQPEEKVTLPMFDTSMTLAEIYEFVEFTS